MTGHLAVNKQEDQRAKINEQKSDLEGTVLS